MTLEECTILRLVLGYLGIGEQVAIEDELVVAQLDGAGADVGSLELSLSRCIQLVVFVLRDSVALIDMVLGGGSACTYGIYGFVGSDVSTYYSSLAAGVRMSVGGDGTIPLVDIVRDEVAHAIFTLAIDTTGSGAIGGCAEVLTVCSSCVGIVGRCSHLACHVGLDVGSGWRCVVAIPNPRVAHVVGEDVAIVVADVVRHVEDIVEGHGVGGIECRSHHLGIGCLQSRVFIRQQHSAFGHGTCGHSGGTGSHRTCCSADVCLLHEVLAVFVVEEIPIPVGDGVVEVVNLGSDEDTVRAYRGLAATGSVVVEGIEVLLHVGEEQRAVGCGSDGQRQVDGLGIGRSRTGVGGDYLVIDVDFATDVPVVCRCSTRSTVASRSGIAVVDDLLRIVDEVAGCLVGL